MAMISTITEYMASAAMTAKKMKAKVMKIITKALTTTIKIISKITIHPFLDGCINKANLPLDTFCVVPYPNFFMSEETKYEYFTA